MTRAEDAPGMAPVHVCSGPSAASNVCMCRVPERTYTRAEIRALDAESLAELIGGEVDGLSEFHPSQERVIGPWMPREPV